MPRKCANGRRMMLMESEIFIAFEMLIVSLAILFDVLYLSPRKNAHSDTSYRIRRTDGGNVRCAGNRRGLDGKEQA